jgi:hypothetical protein
MWKSGSNGIFYSIILCMFVETLYNPEFGAVWWFFVLLVYCVGVGYAGSGYGYIGARNDTTQQSGQTPDKEVEIKNITVYGSGYTETDPTGMLSPPTFWRQQSEFVSSRQSDQMPAAVDVLFLQNL